jgi:predicted DNA-binding transcriptional regulator AlpA
MSAGNPKVSRFPEHGLVRLAQILAPSGPIPVSRSAWFLGVKAGRYPQPVKLGPRITAWRAEDIHNLINTGTKEVNEND